MSVIQTTSEYDHSEILRCSRCNTPLPTQATFCSTCGERVESSARLTLSEHADLTERYHITSLIRRQPHVQLFLANDNQQQQSVAIRDIDMSDLDAEAQVSAIEVGQREYDLLRRQRAVNIMPVIDMRSSQDHLFLIQSWPFASKKSDDGNDAVLHARTLDDLLQSGIGLPDEETAIIWTYRLCQAVEWLHKHEIVIGDLDPRVVGVSSDDYSGLPALMVSWLPPVIRAKLPPTSAAVNISDFYAPEALSSDIETRSDIYSLGAMLYLLLTGSAPTRREEQGNTIRPPRELNARISNGVEKVVVRALSIDSAKRFQNAEEMSAALLDLCSSTKPNRTNKRNGKGTGKQKKPKATPPPVNFKEASNNNDDEDYENASTVVVAPQEIQEARRHLMEIIAKGRQEREKQETQGGQSGEALADSTQTVEKSPPRKQPEHETREGVRAHTTETIQPEIVEQPADEPTILLNPASRPRSSNHAEPIEQVKQTKAAPELLVEESEEPVQVPQEERQPQDLQPAGAEGFPLAESLRRRVTGKLPALSALPPVPVPSVLPRLVQILSERYGSSIRLLSQRGLVTAGENTFIRRLQRFILGEQQHSMLAAALIETPLRVQPNQAYVLRIHIMGRDEPSPPPVSTEQETPPAGLSALVKDELVHIEVRSALLQNFAYIVQQADVHVPSKGYAAEVTIPLQPLGDGNNGRRERLHIFFMDELRNPLYEKPFIIEVFISPHVQPGREGHNVLTIPL